MLYLLIDWLISYGLAAGLMLAALVLEQRRFAPNGTQPQGNLVKRTLLGGMLAAAVWLALVFVLDALRVTNLALWPGFTPWAFALGEALALLTRPAAAASADGLDV